MLLGPLGAVGAASSLMTRLQRRLERRRVRHVALDALLDGVLRLAERVPDEVEREVLVDVGDREQVLEHPFQADVLAIVRGRVQLQQRRRTPASGCRGDGACPSPGSSFPNEICLINSGMAHPCAREKTTAAPRRAKIARGAGRKPRNRLLCCWDAMSLMADRRRERETGSGPRPGRGPTAIASLHFDGCALLFQLGLDGRRPRPC